MMESLSEFENTSPSNGLQEAENFSTESKDTNMYTNIVITEFSSTVRNITGANDSGEQFQSNFPYPSEYTWLHIILSSVVVTLIILLIILGNILVIVAIAKDNNLKGLQNWFIASLAVSDLLLGLLIMPFSLANELMGYWVFGDVLCQMWLSIDVLLCTASILNLCLISLDRYWSITRAVSYVRNRTKQRAIIMITTVWLLSAIICFPPLVGWKRPQKKINGFPLCLLSQEPGYVVYSTLGSFYIPLIVMVIVYFKIYLAARERARRNLKKKQVVPPQGKQSTSTSSTAKDNPSPKIKNSFEKLQPITDSDCAMLEKVSGNDSPAMSDCCSDNKAMKMTVIRGTHINTEEKRKLLCEDTDAVDSAAEGHGIEVVHTGHTTGITSIDDRTTDSDACNNHSAKHNGGYTALGLNGGNITGEVTETEQSDKNSQQNVIDISDDRGGVYLGEIKMTDRLNIRRPNSRPVPSLQIVSPYHHHHHQHDHGHISKTPSPEFVDVGSPDSRKILLPPNSVATNNNTSSSTRHKTKSKKRPKDRTKQAEDPEKFKRKIARAKERRATIVLGVIMATFILCWLPFFSTYLISTLAHLHVPDLVFAVMFWAGYCNSALNPIIYTIFNRDFRLAFQKIIFGRRWGAYY